MFWQARSFKHRLCRAPWANSKAIKVEMFTGSATTACPATFASKTSLKRGIVACLKLCPQGNCPKCRHGPIGEWDISSVTDMDKIFNDVIDFNGDISKWDVSRVTTMIAFFAGATSFHGDLSKWDASSVVDVSSMFWSLMAICRSGTCQASTTWASCSWMQIILIVILYKYTNSNGLDLLVLIYKLLWIIPVIYKYL